MFYLVQFNDDNDYETYHADSMAHALEQGFNSRPDSIISAVFQCIELDDAAQPLFMHEVARLCIHNDGSRCIDSDS